MGRAFEYRKATKLKRWGHMAKTFTRLGKQIAIAVKAGGPEPENNPTLRGVIATCKRENMPKDNIERAIKNAMGKDTSDYKGMTYEGYGPHGVAVFVDTLTDNTTRTVADVRSVFNKFGGNLGTTGSLAFLFDHKCVFTFKKKEGMDMEELILDLIDYNVEDEFDEDEEEGTITIYGDPKSYFHFDVAAASALRLIGYFHFILPLQMQVSCLYKRSEHHQILPDALPSCLEFHVVQESHLLSHWEYM
jgi:YebC/PmpR family DNA-binding regulatory protein